MLDIHEAGGGGAGDGEDIQPVEDGHQVCGGVRGAGDGEDIQLVEEGHQV